MDLLLLILANCCIGLVTSKVNSGCKVHGLRKSYWCLSISDSFQNEGEFAFLDLKAVYNIQKFEVGDVASSYNKYSDSHLSFQVSLDGHNWNTLFWARQNSSFRSGNQTLLFNQPTSMRYVKLLLEAGLNTGDYKCVMFQPFGCKSPNQGASATEIPKTENESTTLTGIPPWVYLLLAFVLLGMLIFQLGSFFYLKRNFRKQLKSISRELALLASGQLNDMKRADGISDDNNDRVILLHHQDI